MKSSFGVQVGRMGKFLGLERTEVHLLSAMPDACLKRAVPLVECHAKQSKFVVGFSAPLVLLVDGLGNDSQVCQSVVGLDAVNVIDLTARPIAVDVQEDNPVLPKGLPIGSALRASLFSAMRPVGAMS